MAVLNSGKGHIRGVFETPELALLLLSFCDYTLRTEMANSCEEMERFVAESWKLSTKFALNALGIKPRLKVERIHCENEQLQQIVARMDKEFIACLPKCILFFGKDKDHWVVVKFCEETHAAVIGWKQDDCECLQRPISNPLTERPSICCSIQSEVCVGGAVHCMSHSGDIVAVGMRNSSMTLFNAHTGAIICDSLKGCHVAFLGDDRVVGMSALTGNSTKQLYEYTGNALSKELTLKIDTRSMKASANGKRLFVSDWASHFLVEYSAANWQETGRYEIGGYPMGHCDIGSNGLFAHNVYRRGLKVCMYPIEVIDCKTGCVTQRIGTLHTAAITHVAFSLDSTRIVSVSNDKTVQVFDAISGEMIGEPRVGHSQFVYSICWLTAEWFVTSSLDHSIIVWHIASQQFVLRIEEAHASAVSYLLRLSDNCFLSGAINGTVKKWTLQQTNAAYVASLDEFCSVP